MLPLPRAELIQRAQLRPRAKFDVDGDSECFSAEVKLYYICLTIQYCFYNGNKDYGACTVVFVIAIDTNWILSKYNTLALV
jgi:hypothetical protein